MSVPEPVPEDRINLEMHTLENRQYMESLLYRETSEELKAGLAGYEFDEFGVCPRG
jgi:hypothetical protein